MSLRKLMCLCDELLQMDTSARGLILPPNCSEFDCAGKSVQVLLQMEGSSKVKINEAEHSLATGDALVLPISQACLLSNPSGEVSHLLIIEFGFGDQHSWDSVFKRSLQKALKGSD